jgi:hypothetical protein
VEDKSLGEQQDKRQQEDNDKKNFETTRSSRQQGVRDNKGIEETTRK